MPKQSAGVLMYRWDGDAPEVLLVHPGGPFWRHRDRAAWSIPKGELGRLRASRDKELFVWAVEGDCDPARIASNTFELEWPPRSGRYRRFPEVDRAAWFDVETARDKLHKGQIPLLDRLLAMIVRDAGAAARTTS